MTIATNEGAGAAKAHQVGQGAWFALIMLCLVYVLNFLDRQLLSILSKPIQDDLKLTDGELGLLGGLYFAAFYCVIGLPVAWLADRGNRARIVGAACTLWSLATIACGLSRTYPELAMARMTVGIGEAGGVPGAGGVDRLESSLMAVPARVSPTPPSSA